jgi:hypothetical protein
MSRSDLISAVDAHDVQDCLPKLFNGFDKGGMLLRFFFSFLIFKEQFDDSGAVAF